MQRTIRQIHTAREFAGDAPGMRKRIPLEPGHWADFDPFLLLAEDWFRQPGGFPDHPHRGIETVTLVLDGELRHADNRGNSGILRRDDAQWMTAGSGIIHAELPHEESTVHSLQLWVNLPASEKMGESGYQDVAAAESLIATDDRAEIRVLSGDIGGVRAPERGRTPIQYLDVCLAAGARTSIPVPAAHNGFVYLIEGAARFGEGGAAGHAGQTLWLDFPRVDSGESVLRVQAAAPARFLLVTGRPVSEPVVAYGPFVMNTVEEIHQAFADYRAGRFGGPTPAALELVAR